MPESNEKADWGTIFYPLKRFNINEIEKTITEALSNLAGEKLDCSIDNMNFNNGKTEIIIELSKDIKNWREKSE